jgi:hypothetical protein
MATAEQTRRRTALAVGGASLALLLLWAGRARGQGAGGGMGRGDGGAGLGGAGGEGAGGTTTIGAPASSQPVALPAPSEVGVWIQAGDRLELDGAATSLETMLVRARAAGRARVRASGDARVGWIGRVVNELRAARVTVLAEPGLLADADYVQARAEAAGRPAAQDARNATRRVSLPRYNERRNQWGGGDSRTLYTFTSDLTGLTWVVPGGYTMNWGPAATVRIATRDEAEAMWQSPLHPGWKVAEAPRNSMSLDRIGNEMFATKPLNGDGVTVLQTNASIQSAIASAPARGDLQIRGEYTSDSSHWGFGRGRVVARRENGRWLAG